MKAALSTTVQEDGFRALSGPCGCKWGEGTLSTNRSIQMALSLHFIAAGLWDCGLGRSWELARTNGHVDIMIFLLRVQLCEGNMVPGTKEWFV